MKVPAHIFREYDSRGFGDTELTDDVSYGIGLAYASMLKREGKRRIALGHDLRKSGKRIHKAVLKGFLAAGAEVIDLGLVPTPVVYFSVSYLKLDAGLCITGSHNPPEYNGFKLHMADRPVFGQEIQKLRMMIESDDFESGKGKVRKKKIIGDYIRLVKGRFNFKRKLTVVIDAGHGMASLTAPRLIRGFGHRVYELYTNLDNNFPDHHPDPTVLSNLKDLQAKVREVGADIGIGFDGDADRIGVVDEKSQVIFGDQILLLYAREILARKPGAKIIGDVKCSKVLYDDIAAHGGQPVMWKTGHSLIKAKLKEIHAELAGEMSGHMFFVDRWFGFDDAVYAACRMLEILDLNPKPLSQHLSDVPKLVSTPEIRVECPEEKKFEIVRRAVEDFKKLYRVVDIDGARVEFDDGWGLVRASNTQPVLVMRFEAKTEKRLNEIRQLFENKIKELSGSI
ncbi:MAG: phosphomannomutase/phosphoglucomutase [Candidatus Omnitrophica bacterium]|nr:phosphomannomutase/phosphoglucomutase [Candidatus Omnitrophota bacterium]